MNFKQTPKLVDKKLWIYWSLWFWRIQTKITLMNEQKELIYAKVEGSGKPMLIIHGFLGMSDNWKTLGSRYAEAGYEVHLLDMRNHGRSFHAMEFNYTVMAQDVVNYCQANNLESIVLIGHSMGGKIAMKVAVKFPELVKKLIVEIGRASCRERG